MFSIKSRIVSLPTLATNNSLFLNKFMAVLNRWALSFLFSPDIYSIRVFAQKKIIFWFSADFTSNVWPRAFSNVGIISADCFNKSDGFCVFIWLKVKSNWRLSEFVKSISELPKNFILVSLSKFSSISLTLDNASLDVIFPEISAHT